MKTLAILAGKLVVLAGKIMHRGSSLPGEIALKIDPGLLGKIKVTDKIIAVTGSSGKGSISSVIANVYSRMGYDVVYNSSGANLKAGILTTLIEKSSLSGKVRGDVVVIEVDERYAKYIFPELKPEYVVVTNITRDQPPRQGNVDLVYEEIRKSLPEGVNLILNGDDPYLRKFNLENKFNATYYVLDKTKESYSENKFHNLNMVYCPCCNTKMKYDFYHFETLGKYRCPECGFSNPETDFHITDVDYEKGIMTVNNKYKMELQHNVLYNVYNTMAAFTVSAVSGLDPEKFCQYISEVKPDNKMYSSYKYRDAQVYVLNNKNENSTTFNQSLMFTEKFAGRKTIVIGWKEISRRYNFDDLSWLYDIDFEILRKQNIDKVICAGPQRYDIATRLKLAGFDKSEIEVCENLESVKLIIDNLKSDYIFGILNFDYVLPFENVIKEEGK